MIDTGGTVINALEKLKEVKDEGAKNVYLMAPHGVFSKDAVERLAASDFAKVIITDSIQNPEVEKYPEKFHVITLAPFLAKVIANVHNSESLQAVVEYEATQ
jgi:ribose-phosphate pyrophosphokinase